MAWVFEASSRSAADILVHETQSRSVADLLVCKVESKSASFNKDGLWCMTNTKSASSLSVRFVESRAAADLIVFFVLKWINRGVVHDNPKIVFF